jgi:hypothetical protein
MGRLAGLGGQWYDEGEHIQVVKYTSAQMYEAHYDYFNPRDYTGQVRCWPLLPPHAPIYSTKYKHIGPASEKDAVSAQMLGQRQPFIAVSPH